MAVKVNLVSTVTVDVVGMLTLTGTADPYVKWVAAYKYPAFEPLLNPNQGSNPESRRFFGKCNEQHLVRSEFIAGVDKISADLNLNFKALSPLSFQRQASTSRGPFTDFVSSGCLLFVGQIAKATLKVLCELESFSVVLTLHRVWFLLPV